MKKLKISDLKVKSFITKFENIDQMKGGTGGNTGDVSTCQGGHNGPYKCADRLLTFGDPFCN